MKKPNFDIKQFYPDMKLSGSTRGISGMTTNNFSADSNAGNLSKGSSIEELKKKYLGENNTMQGGPQKDSQQSGGNLYFTEDSIESSLEDNTGAEIIEPEGNENVDAGVIGKKTLLTENNKPKAIQG